MYRRPVPRVRWLLIGVAALVAAGVAACGSSGQTPAVSGRIAWPNQGDLWVASLPGPQVQKVASLPGASAISSVAWSPDGRQLVYAQIGQRPGERAVGADLILANADGSGARVLAERDQPNTVLDMPQWLPSGHIYYTQLHISAREQHAAIMRAMVNGPSELVVDGGYASTVSADEGTIVYLTSTQRGQTLRKADLQSSGHPDCEVLDATRFLALGPPRLSPDGASLALAAAGDPASPPPRLDCTGGPPSRAAAGPVDVRPDLLALLGVSPAVAWAHGPPSAIWRLDLAGDHLQRVVDLQEDDPRVAWSPDGTRLAIFGPSALYLVDAGGGAPQKLVGEGGYGGLDWVR